jgi:hypothetical protein
MRGARGKEAGIAMERRMVRIWIGALALLAGAGCDSGAPPTEKRKVVIANPHHEQLMKLSELNRSLALRRAIQDSREYCKKIVSSAYVGPYKGQQMWAGRCEPPVRDWAIFIGPSGNVQVRNCADAKTLGLPECKLPEPKS